MNSDVQKSHSIVRALRWEVLTDLIHITNRPDGLVAGEPAYERLRTATGFESLVRLGVVSQQRGAYFVSADMDSVAEAEFTRRTNQSRPANQ